MYLLSWLVVATVGGEAQMLADFEPYAKVSFVRARYGQDRQSSMLFAHWGHDALEFSEIRAKFLYWVKLIDLAK